MDPDVSAVLVLVGAFLLVEIALMCFMFYVYWRISAKAGYPGWYSLAMIVPGLNFIMLLAFGFADWPVEREVAEWREWYRVNGPASVGGGGPFPRPPHLGGSQPSRYGHQPPEF